MAMSPELRALIQKFEGYKPKAYWDHKQYSIGYGTRATSPGEVIDRPEAERRFDTEMQKARNLVEKFAPEAPEGVKDALSSLTYNAGSKWMQSGLGERIKAGDYSGAKTNFVQYNKASGRVNEGLVSRRNAEVKLFDQSPSSTANKIVADNVGSAFDQYPQMDAQEMARNSGGYNASGKNASKSKGQAPSIEASLINDIITQEQPSPRNARSRDNVVTAGYVPKKAPKTDVPFRYEGAGEATHPSQGREVGQRPIVGEDAEGATGPGQTGVPIVKSGRPGEVIGSGSEWVDAGNREMAPPVGGRSGKPTPHMTPSAEESLLRQIEEASGIDRNGNPTFPPKDMPQPQRPAMPKDVVAREFEAAQQSPGNAAATMAGGMGAIAMGGAAPPNAAPRIASYDPVAEEVQKNVAATPATAPAWLDMAMKEFAPNVVKTVATDPAAAQAAQVLTQKVVGNQAASDSQKYGIGKPSPFLDAILTQVKEKMGGGGSPTMEAGPYVGPAFQGQPMNAPVDYYNRGGGGGNQGWSGGYYE